MRNAFLKLDQTLLASIRWAIIALMLSLVSIVFAQILARYLLSISLGWSEEAARLVFICTIFLGAAVLIRRREHLTVTVFTDLLPERMQRGCDVIATGVGLWCGYYLVVGAWNTLMREWAQLTPALRVPMGLIYTVILVAVVLMVLWLAVNLVSSISRLFGAELAEASPTTDSEPLSADVTTDVDTSKRTNG